METNFKAGFVSILGKPNAGKSTLLNAIMGDKLAIVSSKVQTTRHRILGILTEPTYQMVFSDTPGIIDPEYTMHKRMMSEVSASLKDADVVIFLVDVRDDLPAAQKMLEAMNLKMKVVVAINKIDVNKRADADEVVAGFKAIKNVEEVLFISALEKINLDILLSTLFLNIPEHPAYYDAEEISDRPMKFFVGEIIREQLYTLLKEELPYHSTVLVEAYEEKTTLTKIIASIIVTRETQKGIVLGLKGSMIKEIGTKAREAIEKFIDNKVFLELHVKVRKDWRNNDTFLNEYGY
jgi:GTPase